MIKRILKFLKHPACKKALFSELDLDESKATNIHEQLIRGKPFLKKLYNFYYSEFENAHLDLPGSLPRVEIGSGGGFLDEIIPGLIKIDLRPAAKVDLIASAMEIPFAKNSIGVIFMLNVLHHLSDVEKFFEEVDRILVKGGKIVMIEPFVSPLSKIIYGYLHHEPFDPMQKKWSLTKGGAMSSANDALPWIVFKRDRKIFKGKFPLLKIMRLTPHTVFLYLISGGLSYRAFLPQFAFKPICWFENRMGSLLPLVSSMMTIEIKKQ